MRLSTLVLQTASYHICTRDWLSAAHFMAGEHKDVAGEVSYGGEGGLGVADGAAAGDLGQALLEEAALLLEVVDVLAVLVDRKQLLAWHEPLNELVVDAHCRRAVLLHALEGRAQGLLGGQGLWQGHLWGAGYRGEVPAVRREEKLVLAEGACEHSAAAFDPTEVLSAHLVHIQDEDVLGQVHLHYLAVVVREGDQDVADERKLDRLLHLLLGRDVIEMCLLGVFAHLVLVLQVHRLQLFRHVDGYLFDFCVGQRHQRAVIEYMAELLPSCLVSRRPALYRDSRHQQSSKPQHISFEV